MEETGRALLAIVTGVLGLAIVGVIFSANSNTAGVISAASSGFAGVISAATAPVTGSGAVGLGGLTSLAGTYVGSGLGGFLSGLAGAGGGGSIPAFGGDDGGFVDSGSF
jgi:hypothetical protein